MSRYFNNSDFPLSEVKFPLRRQFRRDSVLQSSRCAIDEDSLVPKTLGVAKMLNRWIRKGAPNTKLKWPTKVVFDGDHIPALTAYEYRGYIITAWARPEFPNGSTSVGIVYNGEQLGSIVQVQRIEGKLFESKEQAEEHGVELCKEWIDKQFRTRGNAKE
jgi:hypothetical protein